MQGVAVPPCTHLCSCSTIKWQCHSAHVISVVPQRQSLCISVVVVTSPTQLLSVPKSAPAFERDAVAVRRV